jgi:hypothetical protein
MKYFLAALSIFCSTLADAGHFSAGFAKIEITPSAGEDEVLTLASGKKAVTEVQDPLFVKALVLSDGDARIAFISADLIFVPQPVIEIILARLHRQGTLDQLYVGITHTHSGAVSDNNFDLLADSFVAAAEQAAEALEPVEIGATTTNVAEAYNRIVRKADGSVEMLWTNPARQENRPVDDALRILNFRKPDGTTLVNLVNYSAHPVVTMDLNNVVVSADYPGQMAKVLTEAAAGETIFFLGAAGDVNPFDADTKPLETAIEKSRLLGTKLANAVLGAVSEISEYQTAGKFRFESLPLDVPYHADHAHAGKTMKAAVNTLLLTDDIALASFSGEYFNAFSSRLASASPAQHTFFLGYSNGGLGYVPTIEASDFGGYGADPADISVQVTAGRDHIDLAISSLKRLAK